MPPSRAIVFALGVCVRRINVTCNYVVAWFGLDGALPSSTISQEACVGMLDVHEHRC